MTRADQVDDPEAKLEPLATDFFPETSTYLTTSVEGSSSPSKRYGVIVVLFEPNDDDLDHLRGISTTETGVVAVDNSVTPDSSLHDQLRSMGTTVIANHNRGGLAGAYNAGAELLLSRGCESIFLLDQDSRLPEDFFLRMLAAAEPLAGKAFLLAPNTYEEHSRRMVPVFPLTTRWLPQPRVVSGPGLVPIVSAAPTGTLMSADAFRSLGEFREDFYIEYVEVEYGMRAIRRGVRVYLNPNVTLRTRAEGALHHGGSSDTDRPAWRRYYRARNCALALSAHRRSFMSIPINVAELMRILRFENGKVAKISAVLSGWLDGLRGLSGVLSVLRPERAMRWDHPAVEMWPLPTVSSTPIKWGRQA